MRAEEDRLARRGRRDACVDVSHRRADLRRRRRPRRLRGRSRARYASTASATSRSSPDGLATAASSRNRSSTSEDTEADPTRARAAISAGMARACALERRPDELAEERRRPRRPRLELRMELRRDEPRMLRQLDDLDEPALLEGAADHEPGLDERLAVGVVDLVAVAVALRDHRLAAVHLARARALDELDRLRAEPHRPAEILDLLLLGQQVDHRIRRLGIHLGRVRAVEPARRGARTPRRRRACRGRCRDTGSRPRARPGRRGSCPPSRATRSRPARARRRRRRARPAPPRAPCSRRRPSAR